MFEGIPVTKTDDVPPGNGGELNHLVKTPAQLVQKKSDKHESLPLM